MWEKRMNKGPLIKHVRPQPKCSLRPLPGNYSLCACVCVYKSTNKRATSSLMWLPFFRRTWLSLRFASGFVSHIV